MAENDNSRPIAGTPVTDAAAATAPDDTMKYGSNADLRVAEDEHHRDAAITATGEDIDNDHADERPLDRSQDANAVHNQQEYAEQDMPGQQGGDQSLNQQQQQQQRDGQYSPTE
ncbi:MAG TPA: hypothetical protein VGN36_06265 [Sphingorhabdus sp.]|nr:hypothetical protein [Sphingorhabdus sp.]